MAISALCRSSVWQRKPSPITRFHRLKKRVNQRAGIVLGGFLPGHAAVLCATDDRQSTEIAVTIFALNRMLDLERPASTRIA